MAQQQATIPGAPPVPTVNPIAMTGTGTMAGFPQPTTGAGTGTIPTPTVNPVAMTNNMGTTSISSGLSLQDGSNTLVGDFKDTYGAGTGKALAGVLGNLGTATDGAVSATNAAIEQHAQRSLANMKSGEAASGVTANSSTAALAEGDFRGDLAATVASTDANMELNEQNTLISALQGEGEAHGSDTSAWDTFQSVMGSGILGAIGGAADATNEATGASGSFEKVLSGIAMFA